MRKLTRVFSFLALALMLPISLQAIDAFPGAVGWGRDNVGGRGGVLKIVTTTAASGGGSLEAAMQGTGKKIIIFKTSGVINLNKILRLESDVTIAGQTSPNGITIKNGGLYTDHTRVNSNIIIRHLRIRGSANQADGDCLRISNVDGFVVDHCSFSWNSDETVDAVYSQNGTFSYNSIAEPCMCFMFYCGNTGCGNNRTLMLASSIKGSMTLYRNFMAKASKRTPFLSNMGVDNGAGQTFELINNVWYNNLAGSQESFTAGNTISLNLIGNYYKTGPNGGYNPLSGGHASTANSPSNAVFSEKNFMFGQSPTLDQRAFFRLQTGQIYLTSAATPVKTTTTLDGQQAYTEVMAKMGAWPRDDTDKRLVIETANASGNWMPDGCARGTDALLSGNTSYPTDSDNDGMPDSWETDNGLNPNSSSDFNTSMNNGYMAIEVYVNELADNLLPTGTGTEVRAPNFLDRDAMVRAFPNPFRPSVQFTFLNLKNEKIKMSIFDARGQMVFSASASKDARTFAWDGRNFQGRKMGTGVYLARFDIGNQILQKKVSLIR